MAIKTSGDDRREIDFMETSRGNHFSFNLAVRKIARERKWTIKKTAWFCGVSTSTLRQLMASRHTYISTIERYAAKFNLPTTTFIEKGYPQGGSHTKSFQ